MKTTTTILNALRDRRGAEALLAGDALDGVIEDLEELRRRERAVDVVLKISCVCGAPPTTEDPATGAARCQACLDADHPKPPVRNDDAYLNTEQI